MKNLKCDESMGKGAILLFLLACVRPKGTIKPHHKVMANSIEWERKSVGKTTRKKQESSANQALILSRTIVKPFFYLPSLLTAPREDWDWLY